MRVEASLHSFSFVHHFADKPGFDAEAFIDLAVRYGFSGINLSLVGPSYRHLGGTSASRMNAVSDYCAHQNMRIDVDTSGTDPVHLHELLHVSHALGASTLRTFTHHRGTKAQMLSATQQDLAELVSTAQELGITLLLENHEDFTGAELAAIVSHVNHPNLKILYDYGNSQMVLESPEHALAAVEQHVEAVHVKDHVLLQDNQLGEIRVVGVPVGEGHLPLKQLTSSLLAAGLRRFAFENSWGYSAAVVDGSTCGNGVVLGEGVFQIESPPYDPGRISPDARVLSGKRRVHYERVAFDRGWHHFKELLESLGCTGPWQQAPSSWIK